jgi:hypothetical protein
MKEFESEWIKRTGERDFFFVSLMFFCEKVIPLVQSFV